MGLMALGLKPGDKVATVTTNRAEWNIADMGMAMAGIIHVPIYPTLGDDEYKYILKHAEVKIILAGDKKTGISIMQMDEGLDTGDVLAVGEYEIAADETGASLHDQLMLLGAKALMLALPAIAAQTSDQVKQDGADACYASKLNKAEAKINWLLPGEEIGRANRAYNSWPVAYCFYEKNNKPSILRLWRAEIIKKHTDEVYTNV